MCNPNIGLGRRFMYLYMKYLFKIQTCLEWGARLLLLKKSPLFLVSCLYHLAVYFGLPLLLALLFLGRCEVVLYVENWGKYGGMYVGHLTLNFSGCTSQRALMTTSLSTHFFLFLVVFKTVVEHFITSVLSQVARISVHTCGNSDDFFFIIVTC